MSSPTTNTSTSSSSGHKPPSSCPALPSLQSQCALEQKSSGNRSTSTGNVTSPEQASAALSSISTSPDLHQRGVQADPSKAASAPTIAESSELNRPHPVFPSLTSSISSWLPSSLSSVSIHSSFSSDKLKHCGGQLWTQTSQAARWTLQSGESVLSSIWAHPVTQAHVSNAELLFQHLGEEYSMVGQVMFLCVFCVYFLGGFAFMWSAFEARIIFFCALLHLICMHTYHFIFQRINSTALTLPALMWLIPMGYLFLRPSAGEEFAVELAFALHEAHVSPKHVLGLYEFYSSKWYAFLQWYRLIIILTSALLPLAIYHAVTHFEQHIAELRGGVVVQQLEADGGPQRPARGAANGLGTAPSSSGLYSSNTPSLPQTPQTDKIPASSRHESPSSAQNHNSKA